MAVLAVAHYPDRTEVVLSAADDIGDGQEGEVFERASAYSAERFRG